MTAKKTPSTTASKSTQLTDETKSKVSTLNPDFIMKSDNSTNPTNATTTVNSTTPANADNLFDNEQIPAEAIAIIAATEPPKQQRKSDFAEFKATFLTPAKLVNRHALNIEGDLWDQLERVSRILGDRGTTVSSYANAIIAEHLKQYADDIEIWRKL